MGPGALREAQNLSDAAGGAKALVLNATALLQPLIDDLDPQKKGHYPGSVNGQDAREPKGGEGGEGADVGFHRSLTRDFH